MLKIELQASQALEIALHVCMHITCTAALLNLGNNLSISVLGFRVTFPKYLGLIVRLHKRHVTLEAWAASALTWCYFHTSLVMLALFWGVLRIKFRAVSTASPVKPPSREENEEEK